MNRVLDIISPPLNNRYVMISHNSAEFGGEVACLRIAKDQFTATDRNYSVGA